MKEPKIQWHPAFAAAMELELAKNRKDLSYEREHNLNKKPLAIDLLVIKKEADVQISNEIGKLFRVHNIVEYKSPDDHHLNVDTFYKVSAYTSLYKAYGETVDERKVEDITVTMIREAKPESLFCWLRKHGFTIVNPYDGIYYISNGVLFPTQIVVTKELDAKSHIWLKSLSNKMRRQDMENLLETITTLTQTYDKELADSVLEVTARANEEMINELSKGAGTMSDALLEIFAPFIEVKVNEQVEKRVNEQVEKRVNEQVDEKIKESNIKSGIELLREHGLGNREIKETIMKKFHLTEEEIEAFL